MIPLNKYNPEALNVTANNSTQTRNSAFINKQTTAHHVTIEDIASSLQTSTQDGLTQQEATKRLAAFGYNLLASKKEKTIAQVLLQQFTSVAVYLLTAAAIISFLLNDIAEGIAILIVIGLNA